MENKIIFYKKVRTEFRKYFDWLIDFAKVNEIPDDPTSSCILPLNNIVNGMCIMTISFFNDNNSYFFMLKIKDDNIKFYSRKPYINELINENDNIEYMVKKCVKQTPIYKSKICEHIHKQKIKILKKEKKDLIIALKKSNEEIQMLLELDPNNIDTMIQRKEHFMNLAGLQNL